MAQTKSVVSTQSRGRPRLVEASLLRILDRDRQRFQLHALLREELRNLAPLGELQAAHVVVLEKQFADWEALRILQQEEALCLELGNKDGSQASYGN